LKLPTLIVVLLFLGLSSDLVDHLLEEALLLLWRTERLLKLLLLLLVETTIVIIITEMVGKSILLHLTLDWRLANIKDILGIDILARTRNHLQRLGDLATSRGWIYLLLRLQLWYWVRLLLL
jgi:hypothetical protein